MKMKISFIIAIIGLVISPVTFAKNQQDILYVNDSVSRDVAEDRGSRREDRGSRREDRGSRRDYGRGYGRDYGRGYGRDHRRYRDY
jgi:hypothetical protein